MMKLEWSPDALDDLDEIYEVIALDDEDVAQRFISQLQEKARNLLDSPRIGVIIEELNDESFREFHYKGYTIIYEIQKDAIRVHEVYNQRRIFIRTYRKQ